MIHDIIKEHARHDGCHEGRFVKIRPYAGFEKIRLARQLDECVADGTGDKDEKKVQECGRKNRQPRFITFPVRMQENRYQDQGDKVLLEQQSTAQNGVSGRFPSGIILSIINENQRDTEKEQAVYGVPRHYREEIHIKQKNQKRKKNLPVNRCTGSELPYQVKREKKGNTRHLNPYNKPGNPEDMRIEKQQDGSMEVITPRHANRDKIPVRDLAFKYSPAAGQDKAVIGRIEARPGQGEMANY
jgi:hypothetical protein